MSKPCKWCGVPIFWKEGDADDRWIPYEDEARNIVHDCPKKPIGVPRPTGEQMTPPTGQGQSVAPKKPIEPKPGVPPLSDEEILWLRCFRHAINEWAGVKK